MSSQLSVQSALKETLYSENTDKLAGVVASGILQHSLSMYVLTCSNVSKTCFFGTAVKFRSYPRSFVKICDVDLGVEHFNFGNPTFSPLFNFWDFPSEKIFPSEKCDLDEKKVHYFHHRKSENDGNRRNHIGFPK